MKRAIMSYLNSKNLIYICFAISFTLIGMVSMSCGNEKADEIAKDVKAFMAKKVEIPKDRMDKRYCAMFMDSTSIRSVYLVKFFDSISCSPCLYSSIANHEAANIEKNKNVEFLYIINIPKQKIEETYIGLCSKRVKGTVYLDTCNAFLKANPHIPENELFHTFVINNDGKVLMVGDPFKNKKMEALLDKVISKEKKTFKK